MRGQWSKSTVELRRFVARNLVDVQALSWKVLARKFLTFFQVHLPRNLVFLAMFCPALLFVLGMRAVRGFVVVRITPLNASRFGHLALDPEMFQAERGANIGTPKGRVFDIWYVWHKPFPVCNRYLLNLWKTKLRIWPTVMFQAVDKINRLVPGGEIHIPYYRKNIPGLMNHVQGDPHNVFYTAQPALAIPIEDKRRAMDVLSRFGYNEKSKHVCLVVRDSAHFKNFEHVDLSSHDFRNADIHAYQGAADFLESKGYFVFRMGQITERPMKRVSDRVIDLSVSDFRSEQLDVFLLATCTFCLSSGSGPDAVALAFRRPVLFTNLAQVNQMGLTFSSRFIPRRFIDEATGDEIPLSMIFSRSLDQVRSGNDLARLGVVLVPNTPKEILDATEEMHLRISGEWNDSIGQNRKHEQFLIQVPDYLKQGVVRGGICSTFLDQCEEWTK